MGRRGDAHRHQGGVTAARLSSRAVMPDGLTRASIEQRFVAEDGLPASQPGNDGLVADAAGQDRDAAAYFGGMIGTSRYESLSPPEWMLLSPTL